MIGLESGVIGLVLAYVLLSTLLLVVMIFLPIPRLAKVVAIVTASAFYVGVFFATQHLLGWSAPVAVPDRFQVLWTRVIEPNPARNNPGAIHLWVEELDDSNLPSGEPRAYRLPYSVELARRVSSAQAEIEEGRPPGRTRAVLRRAVGPEDGRGTGQRRRTAGRRSLRRGSVPIRRCSAPSRNR